MSGDQVHIILQIVKGFSERDSTFILRREERRSRPLLLLRRKICSQCNLPRERVERIDEQSVRRRSRHQTCPIESRVKR
jgi:hypothetical protein